MYDKDSLEMFVISIHFRSLVLFVYYKNRNSLVTNMFQILNNIVRNSVVYFRKAKDAD